MNDMVANDGPVPMDLGNVGTHDTKVTQNDSDTSNDTSYEDVCAIAWKGYKAGKGAGKKGPNGSGTWHRGKGADEWPSLKGQNAEALASLETPDEEGEWCWPKKGRVTGWTRKIDSRPAVHYLAEEHEDEQVSRA